MSDLHLEVGQQYTSFTFPISAPYLLLAGDVGRLIDYQGYLAFLRLQTERYEAVLLVLGNHEFYGMSYEAGLQVAQRLTAEPALLGRVVLLHRHRWDCPRSNLSILGCTMWSQIPDDRFLIVESKVSDCKIDGWTPGKHNDVHCDEVAWLRSQASNATSFAGCRKLLIMTHHAPCLQGTSRPEHLKNPWTSAFATDLLPDQSWKHVKVWVFGHTHFCTDMLRDNIRVVANQRGYVLPGAQPKSIKTEKRDNQRFDPSMSITVDC